VAEGSAPRNTSDEGVSVGGARVNDAIGAGDANEAGAGWGQCHPFLGCACSGGA
jgi:hypothetical protein